ncbi:ATP-binding protein [Orientia tsutsugamushi]|nr:putative signal transduction histidine kinase [Orientia tsutsugamushi str. TA763]SPP25162.1 ATP-binding protein [Orientia tsutsugamushi]
MVLLELSLYQKLQKFFLAAAIYIFIFEQNQVATIADQIVKQAKNIGTRWIVTILRGQIELQNAHSKKFSIQKLLKDTINSLKEIAEDREISLSYNVQDNINDIVIVER